MASIIKVDTIQDVNSNTIISSDGSGNLTPNTFTALTISGDLTVDTDTLKVDSSNNRVGVGTTSPSVTFDAEADGATVANFNRATDDGDIIELQKDGSSVGSIGTRNGSLYIGEGDTALKFLSASDVIVASTGVDGSGRDNAIDLGASGTRFKDLYLGGSVYLGGTTSANALDDYEEGTWTPVGNNITFSTAQGTYTKIGRQVIANFRVTFPTTSDTNTAYITRDSGLPFAGDGTYLNYRGGGYVTRHNNGAPDVYLYFGSHIQLTNDSASNYNNSNFSGDTVHGVIIYITA